MCGVICKRIKRKERRLLLALFLQFRNVFEVEGRLRDGHGLDIGNRHMQVADKGGHQARHVPVGFSPATPKSISTSAARAA